jgi:hypothetical protein
VGQQGDVGEHAPLAVVVGGLHEGGGRDDAALAVCCEDERANGIAAAVVLVGMSPVCVRMRVMSSGTVRSE